MDSPRVLVVEDDHDLRTLLSRGLRSHGFEVITAVDGHAALRSLGSIPDAVILDIGLPDADGIDLLRELRDEFPDLQVIILTAHDSLSNAIESIKA